MVEMVLVDYDCGLEHELLVDIAEMCTVVSQRDFGRSSPNGWGLGATVRVAQSTTDIAPGEWVIGFFSHPTVADALGFHDVTASGQPMLHIFPKLETDPADIPVTVMHELIEALIDPTCLFSAVGTDGVVRALETGDPVESDWFEYVAASGRKLRCTNWVLPAWFGGIAGPLDHMGLCTHPGELRAGGYQIVYDPAKGWTQQVAGEKRGYRRAAANLSKTRLDKRNARMKKAESAEIKA